MGRTQNSQGKLPPDLSRYKKDDIEKEVMRRMKKYPVLYSMQKGPQTSVQFQQAVQESWQNLTVSVGRAVSVGLTGKYI